MTRTPHALRPDAALLLLTLACAHEPTPTAPDLGRGALAGLQERAGLVLAEDPWGDGATRIAYLEQGWGVPETLWYYFADQGSALMPYDLLLHLEQPDSEALILDPINLSYYRFLPQRPTPNNPDALPVGLTRHEDQVGFTCAACHTGQIVWEGTAVRVDGAPAMVNIVGFFGQLRAAMAATLADPAKLERLVTAMHGRKPGAPSEAERQKVRDELTGSLSWFEAYLSANASTTEEGYGRLDAIGRIVNQIIAFTSDRKNSLEPNAPNSFPTLWDAPRHDYVQWAGFASNGGVGSLGRNVGEVLGTYGSVEVKHYESAEEAKKGYSSTVVGHAIVSMEESLYDLQSPLWPDEILPAIDRDKAARGAEIYQADCVRCHALLDRDDPTRKVTAYISAIDVVGTDPQSALNLADAVAPTGILEGAITTEGDATYGPTAPALTLLKDLVVRSLGAQPTAAVRALAYAKRKGLEKTDKQGDYHRPTEADPKADLRSYKTRPLNGVWATAPYLHNGSVPTLYDLLLPPEQRPARFAVGRWAYDPVRVGYLSDGELPLVLDTSLTGNHNTGHTYGTTLSDEDRWALVEYLKTL